jgi:antitoxin component YwqK of YwqJK toxin-antitoxin module
VGDHLILLLRQRTVYYDNGQLSFKETYKDGKKEGPWVGYYKNGQLRGKGTFKDGKMEGPWVSYNKDGTVNEKWTGTFKDGEKVK